MGTVWKGRHRRSGKHVAIKVLLGRFANNRNYLEGFHREVRATAQMVHPGIVQVYDHGLVGAQMAAEFAALNEGAPWLAMEYAKGGSLQATPRALSWANLKEIMVDILDALAHAHARGLVHRDLKPANVLRRPNDDDDFSGWMLSDFGIAHVRDPNISERTADVGSVSAGTPLFMAPEQFHGEWRSYGPWTDLYALGCMAYLLTSGKAPFEGPSMWSIALKQTSEPVPPLEPLLAVPDGFEKWLRRLLEKQIPQRYQCSADAAADLALLGDPVMAAASDDGDEDRLPESIQLELSSAQTAPMTTFEKLPDMRTELLDDSNLQQQLAQDRKKLGIFEALDKTQPRGTRTALPPKSWHRDQSFHRAQTLLGAGKGLFGLRQLPFVGRKQERDELWEQLCAVCDDGRPRCAIIRGQAGLGKSRLMQWLAVRANELGAANCLEATHSPIMNANDGLPRCFQSCLGATGLQGAELYERLAKAHANLLGEESPDPMYLGALVEWMAPGGGDEDDGVPVVHLESPLERYLLAEELLQRITRHRPVVLCIDDGQWGQDSLGFARHLMTSIQDQELPVFIVVTVRPNAVNERLVEREYLELLEDDEFTSVQTLAPLSSQVQDQLIGLMLGLDADLVTRISHKTGGNPLFASQLIEDWVNRDCLRESNQGYVLAPGQSLPPDIQTLLRRRIKEIARSGRDQRQVTVALEVGAALGLDIEYSEWYRVCQALDCTVDDVLEDHLMVHGLAVPREGGWRFRLSLFRDCVEEISREQGRWAQINTACALVVDSAAENGTCIAERKARHYVAANRCKEALPLLWKAVDNRMQRSAYIQALALMELIDDSLDATDTADQAPSRVQLDISRAKALRFRGEFGAARKLLTDALEHSQSLDDSLLGDAHRVLAGLENYQGNVDTAQQHYRQALALFGDLGDDLGRAQTLNGLGWQYMLTGRFQKGAQSFRQGYEAACRAGNTLEAAWCLHGEAELAYFEGNLDDGYRFAHQALERFEATGCRSGIAFVLRLFGDFCRHRGDLEEARSYYRRASHFVQATGHVLSQVISALLGFCALQEEQYEAGRAHFSDLDNLEPEKIFPTYLPVASIGLLVIAGFDNDTDRFDALVQKLDRILTAYNPLRIDIFRFVHQAADLIEDHGDSDRAQAARRLLERYQ